MAIDSKVKAHQIISVLRRTFLIHNHSHTHTFVYAVWYRQGFLIIYDYLMFPLNIQCSVNRIALSFILLSPYVFDWGFWAIVNRWWQLSYRMQTFPIQNLDKCSLFVLCQLCVLCMRAMRVYQLIFTEIALDSIFWAYDRRYGAHRSMLLSRGRREAHKFKWTYFIHQQIHCLFDVKFDFRLISTIISLFGIKNTGGSIYLLGSFIFGLLELQEPLDCINSNLSALEIN